MGKLFSLKEWLTIDDAARHLSNVLGEDVTNADVLRLGLDGRLRLSIQFVNHTKGRCGKVVTWNETDWRLAPEPNFTGNEKMEQDVPGLTDQCRPNPPKLQALYDEICESERGKYCRRLLNLIIDDERFLVLSDDLTVLEGVWDLPMIGNELRHVESKYHDLTGGPRAEPGGFFAGAFVEGLDGQICQIQKRRDNNKLQSGLKAELEDLEHDSAQMMVLDPLKDWAADEEALPHRAGENRKKFMDEGKARLATYYPAGALPEDAVIVVRTEALRDFEQTLNSAPAAKPEGYLNHDPVMQQRANQIAEDQRAKGLRVTRDKVAKLLAKELGMTQETVVRRIRKDW